MNFADPAQDVYASRTPMLPEEFVIRLVSNDLEHLPVTGGALRPKRGFEIHAGTPVLKPGRSFGHNRVHPTGPQGFGDLFHFPGAALAVDDDPPDDVVSELLPVQAGKTFLQ